MRTIFNSAQVLLSDRCHAVDTRLRRRGRFGSGGSTGDGRAAGDLWAAGFLYGLVNGYPHEKSGRLASACGYEVCQVVGADIPADGWTRIKKKLEE